MNRIIGYIGMVAAAAVGVFYLGSGTIQAEVEPVVIFTQVPARIDLFTTAPGQRLPVYNGSRIVSLNYKNGKEEPQNLTAGFFAAASPSLSYDNRRVLFSGKRRKEDPWQIWMMNRGGSGKQKILDGKQNAFMPAFLPNGKIVFSREKRMRGVGTTYLLYTCQPDGSDLQQITFHPHRDLYASVLHDGRIAMVSRQLYPETKRAGLMVLRPDGTKAEAFYHEKSNLNVKSIIRETPDRELVFVKGDENVDRLVVVSYADPGPSPRVITAARTGEIQSADILNTRNLVVAQRSSKEETFGIYRMNLNGSSEIIYSDTKYHAIEPVTVRPKTLPPRLPSSVSNKKGFGILVGQNINRSQIQLDGNPETKFIRVRGINRTLEEVPVAGDGSFYLKVQSKMPFRFQSLDENREILREASAWIWLRGGERRGCVGCHTGSAISPANVVPEAIHKPPVRIVDSIRVMDEKKVQAVRRILNKIDTSRFEN